MQTTFAHSHERSAHPWLCASSSNFHPATQRCTTGTMYGRAANDAVSKRERAWLGEVQARSPSLLMSRTVASYFSLGMGFTTPSSAPLMKVAPMASGMGPADV